MFAFGGTDSIGPRVLQASDCIDPDLSKLTSDEEFTRCDGTLARGTHPPYCTNDGQVNCITRGSFRSARVAQFDASKIALGTTIAGIAGSVVMESHVDCTADGQTDCVVSDTLKSADTSTIDANDLRYGKKIAGVNGARKDCRNGMNISTGPALFNYDGDPSLIGNGANTGGINGDWWDTIDDYNNGLGSATLGPPNGISPAWSSEHFCDGSQIADVTNTKSWLTPSGAKINCDAAACGPSANNLAFTSIFRDGYSGLYLTNVLVTSSGTVSWNLAVDGCFNLNSGDGTGRWRLPTQKELAQLYINGIYLQNATKFGGHFQIVSTFWSSTTYSFGGAGNLNWDVNLVNGWILAPVRTSYRQVMCVR